MHKNIYVSIFSFLFLIANIRVVMIQNNFKEADEQENEGARRADGGQRLGAEEVPHDKGVGRVVQLLEQQTEGHRDGKFQDMTDNGALSHIRILFTSEDRGSPRL